MNVCVPQDDADAMPITITEESGPQNCTSGSFPPEGNVKLRNYGLVNDKLRAYTPTSDIHTSHTKGKLVSKFDVWSTNCPPRAKILELLRPEDPGKDALEAIMRPPSRRGLTRPYDEDTKRFLQKALLRPSPTGLPQAATPEPENQISISKKEKLKSLEAHRKTEELNSKEERSLADELREAEEEEQSGANIRRELLNEFRKRDGNIREALERDRLGKLALSVEDDEVYEECGLTAAARRLDALLVESRNLHQELAGIHEDMQAQCARACRCAAAARALAAESRALRYLDDVVALLRGDVRAAERTRSWPFAIGRRNPDRNYII